MRYKHIIWDWNGTLFDDVKLSLDIMNKLLVKNNKSSISLEKYKDVFTFPIIKYYENLGFIKDNFATLSQEFINEYEQRRLECSIFQGVVETLRDNVRQGITQSVLSAYKHTTLLEIIEHFDLTQYFIQLIGQDDIYAHGKIEKGKQWINKLGLDKKDVVMIGDTYHDYEVAQELGVDCILISHGHNSEKILNSTGKVVIENFKDLS